MAPRDVTSYLQMLPFIRLWSHSGVIPGRYVLVTVADLVINYALGEVQSNLLKPWTGHIQWWHQGPLINQAI